MFSRCATDLPGQCCWSVYQRQCHVLSCLCDNACNRSFVICRTLWHYRLAAGFCLFIAGKCWTGTLKSFINWSIDWSICQSIHPSIDWSTDQLTNWPSNQPTDQPTNRSIVRPTDCLIQWPFCYFHVHEMRHDNFPDNCRKNRTSWGWEVAQR